jgi:hypothetical protein
MNYWMENLPMLILILKRIQIRSRLQLPNPKFYRQFLSRSNSIGIFLLGEFEHSQKLKTQAFIFSQKERKARQ